jgi:hypothetical protein
MIEPGGALNYLSLCTATQIEHPPEHGEFLYTSAYGVAGRGTSPCAAGVSEPGRCGCHGMSLKREADRGPFRDRRRVAGSRSVPWRSRAACDDDDRRGVGRVPSCSAVKTPFKKYPIINRLARQTLIRNCDH